MFLDGTIDFIDWFIWGSSLKSLAASCQTGFLESAFIFTFLTQIAWSIHMMGHTRPFLQPHHRCIDKHAAPLLLRQTHTHWPYSPWGCRTVLERCVPRGLIFYSLCPSVPQPWAVGLTVSALNVGDTDSSELWHTLGGVLGVKPKRILNTQRPG